MASPSSRLAPAQRLLVALDTTDLERAVALAKALAGVVGGTKIGLELYGARGIEGVRALASLGLPVFLDLKLHDIPNTVASAVRALEPLKPFMLSVHAAGGSAMLRAAVAAAAEAGDGRPCLVAVTVLTSLDAEDLALLGQAGPVAEQVLRLALLARNAGIDGAVCAPQEVRLLRGRLGAGFTLVVPGIRPTWAAPASQGTDDQKRIMTPAEAIAAGADYLVIGRPIAAARSPREAAQRVAAEIAAEVAAGSAD